MITKKSFDNIIKNNLHADDFGYYIAETEKTYDGYYRKEVFDAFLTEMQSPEYHEAFNRYDNGKGGELIPHNSAHGMLPPKMASVGSSSRFCYLALRDGAAAIGAKELPRFEYGCPIYNHQGHKLPGTAPQLDAGFLEENIFVEAKCHEIFDSHSIVMKRKYDDLIFGPKNDFGFSQADLEFINGEEFKIKLTAVGFDPKMKSTKFDIKQFLCHLLGISCTKAKEEPAELVYLFFKPKAKTVEDQEKVNEVFTALKAEIDILFGAEPIKKFTEYHKIKLSAVAEFAEVMGPLTENNMEIIFPAEE